MSPIDRSSPCVNDCIELCEHYVIVGAIATMGAVIIAADVESVALDPDCYTILADKVFISIHLRRGDFR